MGKDNTALRTRGLNLAKSRKRACDCNSKHKPKAGPMVWPAGLHPAVVKVQLVPSMLTGSGGAMTADEPKAVPRHEAEAGESAQTTIRRDDVQWYAHGPSLQRRTLTQSRQIRTR